MWSRKIHDNKDRQLEAFGQQRRYTKIIQTTRKLMCSRKINNNENRQLEDFGQQRRYTVIIQTTR